MNDKKNLQKLSKYKSNILGFNLPVLIIIMLILVFQIYFGFNKNNQNSNIDSWHSLMTSLLVAMTFAGILQFIGSKIPFLKDIGGGSILCILIPSILVSLQIVNSFINTNQGSIHEFREIIITNFKNFNSDKGFGFSSFFVTSLIVYSFLSMDNNLLKSAFKKFFPLVIISLISGALITSLFGYCLGLMGYQPIIGIHGVATSSYSNFTDTLYYIFVPLSSGGMTAGIMPLRESYSSVIGCDADKVFGHIVPALLVGGIFSIFAAGIIKKIFINTKYNGNGNLEINNEASLQNEKIPKKQILSKQIDYNSITTGFIVIFSFHSLTVLLRTIFKSIIDIKYHKFLPESIVFLVLVVIIIKLLNLINEHFMECIKQASKLVTTLFTSALLVILGFTLNIQTALDALTFPFFLTCLVSVITVSLTAGVIGHFLNFYAVESSITAGLCLNSIGGAGNINILSAANLMELISFAQISTRIGGALIVAFASITYPIFYGL
ncbi:Malate (citrate)/Na+ symporter [Candidatus Phytoplasma mali]|uniref:Malate (Citrate)/Na+ symporter n=1 Tax=Phytoplasma mali (strain AT) TaxID=482235 RepID=B3R0C7_PHYMT|nr:2-hydroxycarboxylate transporter family protein [Candidatus Phytoplasma mali]CAP18291.1 Malate (citrate)/Na+ symporter [Candidatus Phytoplasma mali]